MSRKPSLRRIRNLTRFECRQNSARLAPVPAQNHERVGHPVRCASSRDFRSIDDVHSLAAILHMLHFASTKIWKASPNADVEAEVYASQIPVGSRFNLDSTRGKDPLGRKP